jgi:hypothetical protein
MTSSPFKSMAVAVRLMLASKNPFALIALWFGAPVVKVLFGSLVVRSTWIWFITPLGPRIITYKEAIGITLMLLFALVFVRGFRVLVPTTSTPDIWWETKSLVLHVAAMALVWGYAAGFHAIMR